VTLDVHPEQLVEQRAQRIRLDPGDRHVAVEDPLHAKQRVEPPETLTDRCLASSQVGN
jgi:hypothetical protein